MQQQQTSYRATALRGAAAIGAAQFVRTLLQIGSTVALSRILDPVDFGVIAMVAPLVALALLLQDFGLQQAIIQAGTLSHEQTSRLFWLNVALSAAVALALVALAPLCGLFYGDPRVIPLIIAWSLPLFLISIASHHLALLNRTLRFGSIALIDSAVAVANFAAGLASAWLLGSYWAFLIAAVAGAFVMVALGWRLTGWSPMSPWVAAQTQDLRRFGLNMAGSNTATFLSRNVDNVVVAKFFGPHQLGSYDVSYRFMLAPISQIIMPIGRVARPILGRLVSEPDRYRESYLIGAAFATWISVPGISALAIVSDDFVPFLLGENWATAIPIFAWLGLAGICQPLPNTIGWLFVSQHRTRELFRLSLFEAATAIGSFFAGVPWGVAGVAAAYALSSLFVRLPVFVTVAGRKGPVGVGDLVRLQAPVFVSALISLTLVRLAGERLAISGAPMIALSLFASYALAAMAILATPCNRRRLFRLTRLAAGRLPRFAPCVEV